MVDKVKAYFFNSRIILFGTFMFAVLVSNWSWRNWQTIASFNNEITNAIELWNFTPYLSFWLDKYTFLFFGSGVKLFLGFILFPVFTFYVLSKIFNNYLNPLWSVALSFLAMVSFSEYPFREFLIGLFKDQKVNFGPVQFEVMGYPIPAFSTLIFLLLFHLATKYFKTSTMNCSIQTFLFGALVQIHPVDAIFGLVFWFTYFPIRLYRQKKVSGVELLKKIIFQVLIAFLAFIPVLFSLDTEKLSGENFMSISFIYYLLYFLVPIFLMLILFVVRKIDFIEIRFKFWHVYMLMLLEFFLTLMADVFKFGISPEIFKNRIAMFFLHLYYYVPVIYYGGRSYIDYSEGVEANPISKFTQQLISYLFGPLSKIYLSIFICLLFIFGLSAVR